MIRNGSHSEPVSLQLTNEKQSDDQPFSTAIEDKGFPKLPSPPTDDDE